MPAALQLVTICLIWSLLSSAVLAVVVTHTPRMALGYQAGVGGTTGGGGVVFFLQAVVTSTIANRGKIDIRQSVENKLDRMAK